jgi:hypothetical protein
MTKEDEALLERVTKYAPDVLDSGVDEQSFDLLTRRLIEEIPHPKKKRMKRKRAKAKG